MIIIPTMETILIYIVLAILGIVLGYLLRKSIGERKTGSAEDKANDIVLEAKKSAETIKKEAIFEAKEEIHNLRSNLEKETRERRSEIQRVERRNLKKEESLELKQNEQEKRDRDLAGLDKKMNNLKKQLETQKTDQDVELERIASLSREEAKGILLEEVDKQLSREKVIRIRAAEEEIRDESGKTAQKILQSLTGRRSNGWHGLDP